MSSEHDFVGTEEGFGKGVASMKQEMRGLLLHFGANPFIVLYSLHCARNWDLLRCRHLHLGLQ